MRFLTAISLMLFAGGSALGCTEPVGTNAVTSAAGGAGSDSGDSEALSSSAFVAVEQVVTAQDAPRTNAVARFIRARAGAMDERKLQLAGERTTPLPELGSCQAVERLEQPNPSPLDSLDVKAIELIDVGPLVLEAGASTTELPSRRIPDVSELISGVIYAQSVEGAQLPLRAVFKLRVASGRPMAPLFAARAPGEPANLHIGGVEVGSQSSLATARDGGFDLRWDAGSIEDIVYVDLRRTDDATSNADRRDQRDSLNIRCAFRDIGSGLIPPSAIPSGDDLSLTVHRVHHERIRSTEFDVVDVRFDQSRAISIVRR